MDTKVSFEHIFDTQQKKLAFFQNILLVAIADNYLDEAESDFLVSIGDQLNLTEADTLPITDNLSQLTFIIPADPKQKYLELQTLVLLMLQDGEIEEREYNLCLEFAQNIGFKKEMLDSLVQELLQD